MPPAAGSSGYPSAAEEWTTEAVNEDRDRSVETAALFNHYGRHLELELDRVQQAHDHRKMLFDYSRRLVKWLTIGVAALIGFDYFRSVLCGTPRLPDAVYIAVVSTLVVQTIGVLLVIVRYVFSDAAVSKFIGPPGRPGDGLDS